MAKEYIRRLIVSGPELSETLDLPVGAFTIGRQAGSGARLNDPMVSRRHAQVECTAESCQISDLGSANGTLLNGERLAANTPTPLTAGATIEIGPFKLVFEQIAVELAEPEPPPPKPKPKPKARAKPKAAPPKEEAKEPEAVEPPPPTPPAPPPPAADGRPPIDYSQPPPGLSLTDSRYLEYLPGIYQTDFMARFLAIFESVLGPIEWNVDNFDLYLNPRTTPPNFLPWLANWFSISFDATWSIEKRRLLLSEAHEIFARRGTRWALARVLEIYLGTEPEILDLEDDEDPFTFTVKIPLAEQDLDRTLIENIIDANKPAHTNYKLLFKKTGKRSRATKSE